MIPTSLTVVPAYERKYETVEEAKKAWEEGKDFRIVRGPYCSSRDAASMKTMGFVSVVINLGVVQSLIIRL